MLTIKQFTCNMLSENCYVVSDSTRECVIIDCGAFYSEETQAIGAYIQSNNLKPAHLLCTHGHFDHCMGNGYIYRVFGLKPEIHLDDKFLMDKMKSQVLDLLDVDMPLEAVPVGRFLAEGDIITFGTHQMRLIHTPGHTPGGAVYYCEKERAAFSGDTLFRMSIGRTDFERGSYDDIITSLKRLVTLLPAETVVYPGHGPQTTISDELRYNPYLRR